MIIGMTESNGNNHIFYLTGLNIIDSDFQNNQDVSYNSGRLVYTGRIPTHYQKNNGPLHTLVWSLLQALVFRI